MHSNVCVNSKEKVSFFSSHTNSNIQICCLTIYFIVRLCVLIVKFIDMHLVGRARLSLNKRRGRKMKGKFFALSYTYTLILTGILQCGRTIVSFRRRVESTHHYIDNIDVDFMFASTKSLVFSKQTSSTRGIPLLLLLFLIFFCCCC